MKRILSLSLAIIMTGCAVSHEAAIKAAEDWKYEKPQWHRGWNRPAAKSYCTAQVKEKVKNVSGKSYDEMMNLPEYRNIITELETDCMTRLNGY